MPLPTDPFLAQQWHLGNNTPGLFDLNVRGVWDAPQGSSYTGFGIRTLVIDDGFDYNHADLAPNWDLNLDFDWDANNNGSNGENDLDPFGQATDNHGTAVAGIIGADNNGTGTVGVAFDTSLVGYRLHGFITDGWLQDVRDAIHHSAVSAQADVVNISQGIANDLNSEFGVGYAAARFDEIETSIGTAVTLGRGGLGTTIVKSAGNSRAGNFDVNADDWSNDTRQVVVAAVNQNGFVSSYSSYGAANLVSGFGTPGEVVTTDRTGAAGYNNTDFTFFNGTSAAAPMVAGVVALMYDANANLGWRDVQSILAYSSRHVGSNFGFTAGSERYVWEWNDATTWNNGGLHFSNDYGYGLVDALAAVRMAETWHIGRAAQSSVNQFTNTMDVLNAATVIPDQTSQTFNGNAFFADDVERVTVQMTFSTIFTGDLQVRVTSPNGTMSELISSAGGGNDFNGTWTFETQAFRGERANGTWSVEVTDLFAGDVLTVSDIVIRIFGADTTGDRYVYNNEFSDYDGIGGHVLTLTDTNGGIDTMDASAVTSNSIINLNAGANSTIDGVVMSIAAGTSIERAIGGDGNDSLTGNSSVNILAGRRGDDTYIVQNAADEVLEDSNSGNDVVYTTLSYQLEGNSFVEVLRPTSQSDTIAMDLVGNNIANIIIGNDGNNIIDGRGAADEMIGRAGNDTYYVNNLLDKVFESALAGQGIDRVIASVNYELNAGQEIEILEAASSGGVTPFILTGNEFRNTINGNAGNNILNGKGGNDTMFGLGGNDTYYVDDALDLVIEAAGGGNDRVLASVNYELGAGQEIETLDVVSSADTTAIMLIGNGFAQTIVGNAGQNIIDGKGAADLMFGLSGADTYFVDDAGDRIFELAIAGGGNDRVITAINYELENGQEIETLEAASSGGLESFVLIGNNFRNTVNGNAGQNVIDGKGGNDVMVGLAGNDTYYVDDNSDQVIEAAGGGNDRVLIAVSHELTAGQEIEILDVLASGATTALTLIGNAFGQTIIGNAGNNYIDGRGGVDVLCGLAGNDTFAFASIGSMGVGGNAEVILDFQTLGGDDDILDLSGLDGALTFIGNGAFTGANEVRASYTGSGYLIQINTLGASDAEGEIFLANTALGAFMGADLLV